MMVQTEIGSFGSTFTGLTGKTKADFGNGDALYITFLNVLSNPTIDPTKFEKVDVKTYEKQNLCKKGDLFFNTSSETPEEVGLCSFLNTDVEKLYLNSFCFGFRIKDQKIADGQYLAFYFRGKEGRQLMTMLAQGSTRYNLSKDVFLKSKIDLPSLTEQQNIASALSSIDKLIDDLGRTISKKQLIREGAMEELLSGKKRLPGFTDEWVEKKIHEIGKLTGAGVDKTSNPGEIPVRLLNYLDVYRRNRIANCELHHIVTATPGKVTDCNVKRGDIFFTPSSELPDDIGQSAVAVEDMEGVCYSYHIYRLRPSMDVYDAAYGAYAFQTKFFFDQVKVQSEGSGKRYVVSLAKFRELSVMLPPTKKEQQAIADILTSMDDEISVLQTEKAKYELIRAGMMEELLTGAKRLK